jgi:hypothetical protein
MVALSLPELIPRENHCPQADLQMENLFLQTHIILSDQTERLSHKDLLLMERNFLQAQ